MPFSRSAMRARFWFMVRISANVSLEIRSASSVRAAIC
jgi:hypothetical protein